jgi:chorismate dehydratase
MIFGKIEYLNLLPFHVYMKRNAKSSQQRQALHYKKGVPSQINKAFKTRRVDAAFISSIASRRCKCLDLGIASKKEVKSVLLIPGKNKLDIESATSNVLAKLLGLEGEVIIGDKALRHYLKNRDDGAIDLAKIWFERQNLPFVFTRLCYHGKASKYKNLSKNFLKTPHKVPQYILEKSSRTTQIPKQDILDYLKLIEYRLDPHSLLSLKRFLRLSDTLL